MVLAPCWAYSRCPQNCLREVLPHMWASPPFPHCCCPRVWVSWLPRSSELGGPWGSLDLENKLTLRPASGTKAIALWLGSPGGPSSSQRTRVSSRQEGAVWGAGQGISWEAEALVVEGLLSAKSGGTVMRSEVTGTRRDWGPLVLQGPTWRPLDTCGCWSGPRVLRVGDRNQVQTQHEQKVK